jgi:hypothetical protein
MFSGEDISEQMYYDNITYAFYSYAASEAMQIQRDRVCARYFFVDRPTACGDKAEGGSLGAKRE